VWWGRRVGVRQGERSGCSTHPLPNKLQWVTDVVFALASFRASTRKTRRSHQTGSINNMNNDIIDNVK
jgi:hypothetical protein